MYCCNNHSNCSWTMLLLKGSFFEEGKQPVNEVLVLLDLWLRKHDPTTIMSIFPGRWSKTAALAYVRRFRQLVSASLVLFLADSDNHDIAHMEHESQIGGEGVMVQIDEVGRVRILVFFVTFFPNDCSPLFQSAFGKRKYNRGHHVETKWVFGGVEIVPDGQGRKCGGHFFAVVVNDRSASTLLPKIRQFILPGSIIVSDGWAAFVQQSWDLHIYTTC